MRVYRLKVVYPEGHDKPGWRPVGWHDKHDLRASVKDFLEGDRRPCRVDEDNSCDWEEKYAEYGPDPQTGRGLIDGWDKSFRWPAANRCYLSHSGAKKRAHLLREYGATVTIQRSEPIVWLDETKESE